MINGNSLGVRELTVDRSPPVAAITGDAITGIISDRTRIIDFSDLAVASIIHIEIAGIVHDDSKRAVECRIDGRPAIAAFASRAGTGNRCNNAGSIYLPDPLIITIGNIDISGSVKPHCTRVL